MGRSRYSYAYRRLKIDSQCSQLSATSAPWDPVSLIPVGICSHMCIPTQSLLPHTHNSMFFFFTFKEKRKYGLNLILSLQWFTAMDIWSIGEDQNFRLTCSNIPTLTSLRHPPTLVSDPSTLKPCLITLIMCRPMSRKRRASLKALISRAGLCQGEFFFTIRTWENDLFLGEHLYLTIIIFH